MTFKHKYFNEIQHQVFQFHLISNISMKFLLNVNKTPLCIAIENQNVEIVQLLLMNDKLDVNIASIL